MNQDVAETPPLSDLSAENNASRLIRFSRWLVFFGALLPALGALGGGFYHMDDGSMIADNPLATGPLSWKILGEHFSHYGPLHELLIWAQWHLFGGHPSGFRVVSMLLHAGAALTCLSMLRNLTGRPLLALGAALLWAVHPIQAESVDWITEQKTLLCGLFCFWSLAVYFDRVRPRWQRVVLALLLMAFGTLGKSHGLYVGPVVLVYELCGLSGSRWTRGALCSIPFLFLTAFVAWKALHANRYSEGIAHWTLRDTVLNMPCALLIYLRTAFLPWTASFFQEMDRVTAFASPSFWGALLALFWVFAAGCFAVRPGSRRLFIFLALAWVAALGPMLNISQTTFPAYDRFQYVALPFLLAGAAILLEGCIKILSPKAPPAKWDMIEPLLWSAVLGVVVVLGFKRGLLFAHEADVMADAFRKAPNNACAPAQLASTLYFDWQRANDEYQRSRDNDSHNERQRLAKNIDDLVQQALVCPNFADFYVMPVPLLKMAGNVLYESGLPERAAPLLDLAISEPRWERFERDRADARRLLAILALDYAKSRIQQAEAPGVSPEVAQELARIALKNVERSREIAGNSDTGFWWEYKAHAILSRCLRQWFLEVKADDELRSAEAALKQIETRSRLYLDAQKALRDLAKPP